VVGDFYAYQRRRPELTYSDRVIYSPAVPVFRDDTCVVLPVPYRISFLTAAAPNRSAITRTQPDRLADIPIILRCRATRILDLAAAHGHRRPVLGAWGCEVSATTAAPAGRSLRVVPWSQSAELGSAAALQPVHAARGRCARPAASPLALRR
jgi:uncharacterized protein (TIGR02452 family)